MESILFEELGEELVFEYEIVRSVIKNEFSMVRSDRLMLTIPLDLSFPSQNLSFRAGKLASQESG